MWGRPGSGSLRLSPIEQKPYTTNFIACASKVATICDHAMTSCESIKVYADGIAAIDTGFAGRDWGGAVYLMQHGGRSALIDAGTSVSVPRILAALDNRRVQPEDVDYIVVTHVHLDHAGGAGALMQRFPQARLVAHSRGVDHIVDPEVLAASVAAVFGPDLFAKHFGHPTSVPRNRVIEATPGLEIDLAGRPLRFLDTPGHVGHHLCVVDALSRGMFTGDALGYSFPQANLQDRAFVVPATPPPDFDPQAMQRSIDLVVDAAPEAVYLGHGGRVAQIPTIALDLRRLLDKLLDFGRKLCASPLPERLRAQRYIDLVSRDWQAIGCKLLTFQLRPLLEWDALVNCQGLAHWAERERTVAQ